MKRKNKPKLSAEQRALARIAQRARARHHSRSDDGAPFGVKVHRVDVIARPGFGCARGESD